MLFYLHCQYIVIFKYTGSISVQCAWFSKTASKSVAITAPELVKLGNWGGDLNYNFDVPIYDKCVTFEVWYGGTYGGNFYLNGILLGTSHGDSWTTTLNFDKANVKRTGNSFTYDGSDWGHMPVADLRCYGYK